MLKVTDAGHDHYCRLTLMPLSDGTPAHIRIHFIFLASGIIGLHFATNDIGLRLNFSGERRKTFYRAMLRRARLCDSKSSVRLSVCLSVCDVHV